MILTLAVGVLAGVGAVARHALDRLVSARVRSPFPYGTMLVNVSGSFVLGLVLGAAVHAGLPHGITVALSAGFCSGYTTWSTLAYETAALGEAGSAVAAGLNVVASVVLGLLAAAAGLGLALL